MQESAAKVSVNSHEMAQLSRTFRASSWGIVEDILHQTLDALYLAPAREQYLKGGEAVAFLRAVLSRVIA